MTTDIELLPLPELASERVFGAKWDDFDMHDYARANVAHATEAMKAEIEALRAVRDSFQRVGIAAQARAERLAEALRELVALGHPRDPAIIAAKNALRDHDQERKDG